MTLLAVLIYHQTSQRKNWKENKRQKVEEEEGSTLANHHVNHLDVSEKRRDLFLQANSSQPWDREIMTYDERKDDHDCQFRPRVEQIGSHFWCPDCSIERQRGIEPTLIQWNKRINAGIEAEEETEERSVRMTEEERRRLGSQQGILSRGIPNELLSRGNISSSFYPWNDTFGQRQDPLAAYREMGEKCRTDMEGERKAQETSHCKSCHRTYRLSEQNMRQGRINTNMRDSSQYRGLGVRVNPNPNPNPRVRTVNYNQLDMMRNTEFRQETRNVTFDLERSTTQERGNSHSKDKRDKEERISVDKERGRARAHKAKVQSSPLLKVKQNLNPLRKSKVHPKRKIEQGNLEKSSAKKSKDKGYSGIERGERKGKGQSGMKTKSSSEKIKKSTKNKRLAEIGKDEKEEDRKVGGQKSNNTSKSGQNGQESTACDQSKNKHPENSKPGEISDTIEQSASAINTGQGQNSQGGSSQYQGAGSVLGSSRLSLQHPLSLSGTNRNHTANLSVLTSAGTQLTGRILSLQGGNLFPNTMATGSNTLSPRNPANTATPWAAISGPNKAPSGGPDGLNGQTGVGLVSPPTSSLANTVHNNPLRPNLMLTSAIHTQQPLEIASSLTANPAVNPAAGQSFLQNQLPSYSSPVQAPGLQTGKGVQQVPPESQASQTKESLTLPTKASSSADGLSVVTPQLHEPATLAENLSNNNSQKETGYLPAALTVNTLAVAVTEALATGVSGDYMQAADVSLSGISTPSMSTQSVPVAAASLLQQEYLSEEGGSSPRRKLRLALPEKTSSRPPTALERKIR